MLAFRTFLGDDDEFSNLPGGVSKDVANFIFCLFMAWIHRLLTARGSVF